MNINFKKIQKQKGALLLELLIVISLLTSILTVAANATFLSMRSNKASGERDIASSLASESFEAVRATSEEDWQNIYALTKSTGHYYPTLSGSKWVLTAGDQAVVLNSITYTRYLTIDNISRDNATRAIQTSYTSANDDPSTQKVTVNVSWPGGSPLVVSQYFFRWKNKVCAQTSWVTADPGNTVHACTDTTYDVKDAAINVTGGTLKLQ